MCLFLYIAAEHPLPLKPWNKQKPDFNVCEISNEEKKILRTYFSVPHIRYAGSEEHCGCAFIFGREGYPLDEDDVKELAMAERSRTKLFAYIQQHHVKQIYTAEYENRFNPPKSQKTVPLAAIMQEEFSFNENELITLEE